MYEQYLIRLLAPLSLYNLRAPHNGGELAALGGELDSVSGLVELVERESLLATAESEGLDRREVLFAHKPAAVTQEDRREAIAALLRISEDSLTPEAINDTLTGCGIRARAEEKADGSLRDRRKPGAMITDTTTAIDRVVRMVKEQKVTAYTGEDIPVVAHSVCVHGDGARALEFVQALRSAFAENGIAVAPLAEVIADV